MKKINYRHYICIAITLAFLCVSVFVFPHSFGRLIESVRDLGLSIAYYFCELFGIPHSIIPTVNSLPEYPFFPFLNGYNSPVTTFPDSWSAFIDKWRIYWGQWANISNFKGYLSWLGIVLFAVCKCLIIIIPFAIVLLIAFRRYLKKQNNNYNDDSKPLRVFKRIVKPYPYIKAWIVGFIAFVQAHKAYWIVWLCLWLYNFNVFTIIFEFLAFYFYFVISFDVFCIYKQVYKLFLDLWSVFNFVPLWVWLIAGIIILHLLSLKVGYNRLYHNERRNRGFLNSLGTVRIVKGVMNVGKTALLSDMSLSDEVQLLDDAFEIILEVDMQFPYFPWINFENELKRAIHFHEVYDTWACRRWVRKKYSRWVKNQCSQKIFSYDYQRYGLTYNDNLKLSYLWENLEDYACAYFIYTVQSSYIIANYSIRSDKLISDIGNFPLWNTDFFRRDSRLIDSYSRHAHILDFDMLRLGKKMLENNPNRNAFGFGIYVVSEIDKERKNAPELQEVKKNAAECNQKNDLVNITIKMSRHACVIRHRVFDRFNVDLQRTGSLNSDMVELGDVIDIKDKSDLSPVLPFFAPFYFFDLVFGWLKVKFDNFYLNYRYNRGDNTLLLYLFKSLTAKFSNFNERICNLFGSQILHIEVNGEGKFKWYRMPKKAYSKRYSTDCLSGIFEARAESNFIGIDDLQEYSDVMADAYELGLQNSHFWNEINNLNNS